MIARLLRQEEGLRFLRVTLPLAIGLGLVAGGALSDEAGRATLDRLMADPEARAAQMAILMAQLGVLLVLGQVYLRSAPFHLVLPLPARTLWRARMVATQLTVLAPTLAGMLTYAWFRGVLRTGEGLGPGLNFLAVLFVLPFVYQLRFTRTHRSDDAHPYLHWCAFAVLAVSAQWAVARLAPSPLWFGPACLALAVVLGGVILRSLPAGFELSSGPRGRRRGRWVPVSPGWLRRIPFLNPFAPLNRYLRVHMLMSLNVWALVLGTGSFVMAAFRLGAYMEAYGLLLFQVMLLLLALPCLPRVAPLPVPPRRLALHCLGPGLAMVLLSTSIGIATSPHLGFAEVAGSNAAALGAALYVLAWFGLTAAVLAALHTPPRTKRQRRARRLKFLGCLLGALVVPVVALAPGVGPGGRFPDSPQELLRTVGAAVPVPAPVSWLAVAVLAWAAIAGLGALLARIELFRLEKILLKWQAKFG